MSTTKSFDALPPEIASSICSLLKQSEVSNLSFARKSFYQLVRPILYRHPTITAFTSLILFSRTISQATYMGKVDRKWSERESLDQTRTLDLTIDPTRNDGQTAPAVMISRTIQAIVRRCPNLAISLCFAHCRCNLSPVADLETEIFPGVTNLIVYVGTRDPEDSRGNETDDNQARACVPGAKFWRPFVNGVTFPDCAHLEIRHFWATTPPCDASLDLMKKHPAHNGYSSGYTAVPGPRTRFGHSGQIYVPHSPLSEQIGSTDALKSFESIVLECPPELDSLLLMQLLGNPDAVASNLTSLELRFCNLSYETYEKLLYHAPPNIKRLVLLCANCHDFNYYFSKKVPHLCPLIRDFSRRLTHLEFGASRICRELFFDDLDSDSLRHNAVETGLGANGGAEEKALGNLDRYAIRETVQACRQQKRINYRDNRISQAICAAKSSASSKPSADSIFGGSAANDVTQVAAKAKRETEALLDEEEGQRSRLVQGSKIPWFRRFIAYHALCGATDTWAEMQVAAEMEEKGIECVLMSKFENASMVLVVLSIDGDADKRLQVASQHSNGRPSVDISVNEALNERYQSKQQGISDDLDP